MYYVAGGVVSIVHQGGLKETTIVQNAKLFLTLFPAGSALSRVPADFQQ